VWGDISDPTSEPASANHQSDPLTGTNLGLRCFTTGGRARGCIGKYKRLHGCRPCPDVEVLLGTSCGSIVIRGVSCSDLGRSRISASVCRLNGLLLRRVRGAAHTFCVIGPYARTRRSRQRFSSRRGDGQQWRIRRAGFARHRLRSRPADTAEQGRLCGGPMEIPPRPVSRSNGSTSWE
jgi:hypothetical protein